MASLEASVARALLEIGAVEFRPASPVMFKSGLISPVYVDNRRLPFWPNAWRVVLNGFQRVLAREACRAQVIAGVEAAGIPHSAALGYAASIPSVFVRKQLKDHGLRELVEGGDVTGRRVVLVEDMVTTGGSSLAAIGALRKAGAIIEDCVAIVTYGFPSAQASFDAACVRLHPLTTFHVIAREARSSGRIAPPEWEVISDWLSDPAGWSDRARRV